MSNMHAPVAIIDLGTNTFHLLIATPQPTGFAVVHKETRVMKIGQGGISQGLLTADAYGRTLEALGHFRRVLDQYAVSLTRVFATATSAIRNAANGPALVRDIEVQTAIHIEVISGAQEAEYIYYGVRAAVALGPSPALVMDIGGGSVEFIIGNESQIFWKQSFEIGAQRLLDQFMTADPLPPISVTALYAYLASALTPLTEAVRQYQPRSLVGSSGSFDTLVKIHALRNGQSDEDAIKTEFSLPIDAFFAINQEILPANRAQRLGIPGMLPMRVDMIVVACCVIDFVLQHYPLQMLPIRVSSYALKEGVLQRVLEKARELD